MSDTPLTDAAELAARDVNGGVAGMVTADFSRQLEREKKELREQFAEALNPIHTCHYECQRPACVLRRERDKLKVDCMAWSNTYHAMKQERDQLKAELDGLKHDLEQHGIEHDLNEP